MYHTKSMLEIRKIKFHALPFSDVDNSSQRRQMCGGNEAAIEKMLFFGRELKVMSQRLRREYGKNETNKKALQVCFII